MLSVVAMLFSHHLVELLRFISFISDWCTCAQFLALFMNLLSTCMLEFAFLSYTCYSTQVRICIYVL